MTDTLLYLLVAGAALAALHLLIEPGRSRLRSQWRVRSAMRALHQIRTFDGEYANARRFTYLRKLDPFVFEELVLYCFRERGLKTRRSPYTRDGGIDGTVWLPDGRKTLVQSKRYTKHIHAQHVREFHRVVARQRVLGLFVHTGRTGRASWLAAGSGSLTVLSGGRFMQLLMGGPFQCFGATIPAVPAENHDGLLRETRKAG